MLDMKEGYKLSSAYHLFENNQLVAMKEAYHWQFYWPLLYTKDVLYTFFWCLKFRKKIDVYFAAGNLNPIAGIILRKFGFVKKVVYQSIDYYPQRFSNKFFNWLYFQLDKFCVKNCDETWNVSSMIAEAREKKMGMDRKIYNKQHTVPVGVWFYKTKRIPFEKINRKKIVYRGTFFAHMGVDLPISAMPLILKKIPDVTFEIMGSGEEEENLRKLTKNLGVYKNVIFHGMVTDRKKLEKILSTAAVGIATFNTKILDAKITNADPGKIKEYMVMGMPVITTNAVYYYKKIQKNECGIIIDYNTKEMANAVIKLLEDEELLRKYRNNTLKFIEQFDCNKLFHENVARVLN